MEFEESELVVEVGSLQGFPQSFDHNDKEEGGQRVSLSDASRGAERLGGRVINQDRKEGS